jgi:transcriptional regulator with XRE-family HTH domain
MAADYADYVDKIKKKITKAGYTIEEFAKKCGITEWDLRYLFTGKYRLTQHQKEAIDKVLAEGTKAYKIRPEHAAKALGSNAESVRIRMQRGAFVPSIGTCCKLGAGSERYSYEIYPEKLADYLGISLEKLYERMS